MGRGKKKVRYLPDANIFIRAAKGDKTESSFLNKAIKDKQMVISSVVVAEFLVKAGVNEEVNFTNLLSIFPIIPVDLETAKLAAEYRKESLKSKRVQLLDCFLAAQAKVHKLTLVTNNKADFPMKDIKIITP